MIYATLGLCALGAAVLVYRCELYDREPLPLVGVAIVLGAGAMAVAGRLEAFTFERFGLERRLALAGVAALEEEALKLLAVAALALHFGWDALAVRSEDPGAGGTRDGLLGAALMLAGFLLYGRLVALASSWSQKVFSPGRVRRLGSWPFAGA